MNYRHIYHAGSFSDVFKHTIVCLIMQHLRNKDTPFFVLDTHAGTGLYDILSEEAQKTEEAQEGILKILKSEERDPSISFYLDVVRSFNKDGEMRFYPGSPSIFCHFMRPQDRMVLAELHKEDARILKSLFEEDKRVAVHYTDGYAALKAHLPPKENRGVVLVDPSFESSDEFASLVTGLISGYKRWPNGIFALWYPIKERPAIWRFEEALTASGIRRILKAELLIHPEDTHLRLNGCGMIIVNPPWQLEASLKETLPLLEKIFGHKEAKSEVTWLVAE